MKYTVLTYVPRRQTPVAIGRDAAVSIRELGCSICVVGYDGKLKPCWRHKDERVLWAITVEGPEEEFYDGSLEVVVPEKVGTAEIQPPTGAQEPMEVLEGSLEL